jgi:hypothetical protein
MCKPPHRKLRKCGKLKTTNKLCHTLIALTVVGVIDVFYISEAKFVVLNVRRVQHKFVKRWRIAAMNRYKKAIIEITHYDVPPADHS